MSIADTFKHGKQALRRGTFALATAAAIFGANAAQAANFTAQECRIVAAVSTDVVRALGKDTLSVQFRQSFRNFLGKDLTCDGPLKIATPTEKDIAAFTTIAGILASGPRPIDLKAQGLQAVASLPSNSL